MKQPLTWIPAIAVIALAPLPRQQQRNPAAAIHAKKCEKHMLRFLGLLGAAKVLSNANGNIIVKS